MEGPQQARTLPDGGEGRHRGATGILTPAAAAEVAGRALAAAGLRPDEVVPDETPGVFVAAYVGRDAAGHAVARHLHVDPRPEEDVEGLVARLIARLASQIRTAERAAWTPPVTPGPGMPLRHLTVNVPLMRRLRADHGPAAADVLREALVSLLAGRGGRLAKDPRPYGIVLDANRLDHRETLADGVEWKGRALVLRGVALPDQILSGLAGMPAEAVLGHPLVEGMTIAKASCQTSAGRGPTTVVEMACDWMRADDI